MAALFVLRITIRQFPSHDISNRRRRILPLLGGEGRGEGERKLSIPITAGGVCVTLALILTFSPGEKEQPFCLWQFKLYRYRTAALLDKPPPAGMIARTNRPCSFHIP